MSKFAAGAALQGQERRDEGKRRPASDPIGGISHSAGTQGRPAVGKSLYINVFQSLSHIDGPLVSHFSWFCHVGGISSEPTRVT